MNLKSKVIAIDGPSGSGKSTIAKLLANKLNLTYLDTGAMFRAIAFHINEKKVSFQDIEAVKAELNSMNFSYDKDDKVLVEINGKDLTQKIREHFVSKLASEISQIDNVRDYLKKIQREIASVRPSILEGRDIGTVIFPDAQLKFFLTADPEIRAERRLSQLKEKGSDIKLSKEQILQDIITRDESDRNREVAPLVCAADAIEINTTSLSIDQAVNLISDYFQKSELA